MRPLSPRERRLVAVGLVVLALAVAWLGVVSPILAGFAARAEERRTLTAAFQRNQRLAASVPALAQAAAEQRRTAGRYVIDAPTQAQAAEALGRRLNRTLTDAGGRLTALQPAQADVPPGWAAVRADAELTLPQLQASLAKLESEQPYVLIDYFSVAADRPFQSGQPLPLAVRLQVAARFAAAPAGRP